MMIRFWTTQLWTTHRLACGVTGIVVACAASMLLSAEPASKTAPTKTSAAIKTSAARGVSTAKETENDDDAKPDAKSTGKKRDEFTTGSSDVSISYINEQIRQGWTDNKVEPSNVASDSEWVRRVHLDIVGHVPPMKVVEEFIADKGKAKRSKVIDKLLDDPGYVRNWTTIWTNLTIGQQTPQRVSRKGMQKFLREAFAKNRPWNEVVYDIISAEGHFEENGAVNFILAQMQMPDDGVQATAKTTRLFMGMQVQCTQCHNHPFNDWKQSQFWEFNTFFRQLRKEEHQKYDMKTGRNEFDYAELKRREGVGENVFFERRNGLQEAAYPKYFDKDVLEDIKKQDENGYDVNRRAELAKQMIEGEKPLVAAAMVNRTWGHFFGFGFTKPVDDIGKHNAASHPELMERLAVEFVKSRYDVKQLIRWICNSEAYNLSSQAAKANEATDNPAAGTIALFTHMYLKSMSAEQLYDSLLVATNAHQSGRSSWEQAEQKRQQWLQQFVLAFGTDEGDESTTFNGSIPQALMMMNGELVKDAISAQKGSYLNTILTEAPQDKERIRKLYLATLSRAPNAKEQQMAQTLLKFNSDKLVAYQDMFWALLNSNEFIFIH